MSFAVNINNYNQVIDSELILKYIDALYIAEDSVSPRYDEFRDMFSRGQLESKFWLITELQKILKETPKNVLILGSWFGLLAFLLNKKFPETVITCLDQDPRCEKFIKIILSKLLNSDWLLPVTEDLYHFNMSSHTVVINTSCEHLPDQVAWLQRLPQGTFVAVQSNNYQHPPEHVNCVFSLGEFENQVSGEVKILFSAERDFEIYKRFMIIGQKI